MDVTPASATAVILGLPALRFGVSGSLGVGSREAVDFCIKMPYPPLLYLDILHLKHRDTKPC